MMVPLRLGAVMDRAFRRYFGAVLGFASGLWADGNLQGAPLTVATYNVENYVATNRMVDGVYRENYPKPEAEKQALRTVIRALHADILALQEMGPRPYLEELRHDLAAEELNYRYAELLEGEDPERHIAVLSKVPIVQIHGYTRLSFKYFGQEQTVKRGLLELHFGKGKDEFVLFVVHLKSRLTDREDDPNSALRRVGEAVVVRDQILRIFPDPLVGRFAIIGDFNDSRSSRAVRAVLQRGKTPLAEILPATDSRGETWTHYYRREETYSQVDHILVSAALKPAVVNQAAQIYDGPQTGQASDHRPVSFVLSDTK